MMGTHSTGRIVDRSDLRFVETVQDAFRFLVEDFDFRLARVEPPTFVRYESATMFLNVYHGRRSYEINLEIGGRDDPVGRSYRLPDVLSALLEPDDRRQTFFQASNPQAVRWCVQAVAELVARYCAQLLNGDMATLAQVASHHSEAARDLTRNVVQRPVREAAERAWHAKDYAKVRELYESMGDGLSPLERKRLEYAEKRLRP